MGENVMWPGNRLRRSVLNRSRISDRGLFERHSDWYRDAVAGALGNLAIDLRTLGNDAEARQVERERDALGG
ncbi:hypothetical protein ACI79N_09400 [Geodermatophilus sp. SYSU D00805]